MSYQRLSPERSDALKFAKKIIKRSHKIKENVELKLICHSTFSIFYEAILFTNSPSDIETLIDSPLITVDTKIDYTTFRQSRKRDTDKASA
jgi:hypothetical protein